MIFYHFTSRENIDSIKIEGITKGEIPITPTYTETGVWLTTDQSPDGHGLSSGEPLSRKTIIMAKKAGILSRDISDDSEIFTSNKRAVRITVKVHSTDKKLISWLKYGRKHIDPSWFQTLNSTGGGTKKAKSWYILFRPVTLDEIQNIEFL